MIEYLNSINTTKKNIIRDSEDRFSAEKSFPAFPVLRSLSYHVDAVQLVNELNTRSLDEFGLTPIMKYEFLLDVLPKKKRFAKWAKSEFEELAEIIVELENISYAKALEIIPLLSENKIEHLRKLKSQKDK